MREKKKFEYVFSFFFVEARKRQTESSKINKIGKFSLSNFHK